MPIQIDSPPRTVLQKHIVGSNSSASSSPAGATVQVVTRPPAVFKTWSGLNGHISANTTLLSRLGAGGTEIENDVWFDLTDEILTPNAHNAIQVRRDGMYRVSAGYWFTHNLTETPASYRLQLVINNNNRDYLAAQSTHGTMATITTLDNQPDNPEKLRYSDDDLDPLGYGRPFFLNGSAIVNLQKDDLIKIRVYGILKFTDPSFTGDWWYKGNVTVEAL